MTEEVKDGDPGAMLHHMLGLMRGAARQMFVKFGDRVINGPFKGMRIPEIAHWDDGNATTKLIGCYEFELHDVLEKAIARKPGVVVNIGCAEGYYAIGFAGLIAETKVYAYDVDQESLDVCFDFAHRNGVAHKMQFRKGVYEIEQLREITDPGHRLYILDCEIAEMVILDKKALPELITSDILVECHDFMYPDLHVTDTLYARFIDTHEIEVVRPQLPRLDWPPFEDASVQPAFMTAIAIVEKRPVPTAWLYCTPR